MFTLSRRFNHLCSRSCRDHGSSRCNVVSRHRCNTRVLCCSTNFGSLHWYVKQIGSALTFIYCHLFCCLRVKCFLASNTIVSRWDGGQIQTTTRTAQGMHSKQIHTYLSFILIKNAEGHIIHKPD